MNDKQRTWSDEDLATLTALYVEGKTQTKKIASILNRTPHIIRQQAYHLGLRRFHPEKAVNIIQQGVI